MTDTLNNNSPAADGENAPDTAQVAEQVVPQMELGELLEGAVAKAVSAQINAQAKEIAEGVVAAMLTPEVIAGMRETAIAEAELALNPAPATDTAPESGTADAPADDEAGDDAEEAEEEPRQLRYATLPEFVEDYVANLYRREVSMRGSEKKLRWCPRWWDHGEVVARFRAMWTAFEALRLGEGVEQSLWWLVHFDPHMDRIFDTDGPFKYCSVADGHNAKLPALPTMPVPAGLFEDGHYDDAHVTRAGIFVPATSPGAVHRRPVDGPWEFPG
ncbi:DUF4913 domain-containing protein [Nocardia otitidiscaviarum]|uniref:DUF4913 domain-containing protein n=1 Tax=Nocardia otitidiscaviarum TaxID=1823 RepID=UPI001895E3F1|nr:DUF4913 domain-containing protein [Nocardia otitidiscaviarum]MBF6138279.1 DUF4913 domain-containing protein [Nocardia otitidiscaviarum]